VVTITEYKMFELMINGSIIIRGNSFEEAETNLNTKLHEVSEHCNCRFKRGEKITLYHPGRVLEEGDRL